MLKKSIIVLFLFLIFVAVVKADCNIIVNSKEVILDDKNIEQLTIQNNEDIDLFFVLNITSEINKVSAIENLQLSLDQFWINKHENKVVNIEKIRETSEMQYAHLILQNNCTYIDIPIIITVVKDTEEENKSYTKYFTIFNTYFSKFKHWSLLSVTKGSININKKSYNYNIRFWMICVLINLLVAFIVSLFMNKESFLSKIAIGLLVGYILVFMFYKITY